MIRLLLFLYNLVLPPVFLAMLPSAVAKARRRGGFSGTLPARFGFPSRRILDRIGTGRIWIHAVSVGEVGIALKFCAGYRERNPEARFLLTTTTPTALAIASEASSDWLEAMPNPVDLPIVTSRLTRLLSPSALLMVEADLWPNRISAAKAAGIPVALLNARLSTRSERRFRLVKPLSAALFGQLDLITLTDPGDPDRWHSLGLDPRILHLVGNIKHDGPVATVAPATSAESPPLLLAASTHRGEEEEIAKAYLRLHEEFPHLSLLIAPRHAERREEIRSMLASHGVPCTLRSEGGELSERPLVLDTTGELASWYPKASVVFVGKSLPCSVNKGGQNMIEPIRCGVPVLIGPHTGNFEPLATHLSEATAVIRVTTVDEIVATVRSLLGNREKQGAMIMAASGILKPHQGAVQRNCELVENLLSRKPSDFGRKP
jgi:3-deoxy-D-manno-octulosonic-acid transferase